MREIETILSDATAALRSLLEEAFKVGKAEGRREAAEEFKSKIAAVLGGEPAPSLASAPPVATPATEEGRATPGTVKPTIMRLIAEAPNGLTTQELTERTGFKHNSIRGTLWTLKHEGAVLREDNRWVAASKHPSASGNHHNGGNDDDTRLALGG